MKKLVSAVFVLTLLIMSYPVIAQTDKDDDKDRMPDSHGMFMNMPGITESQKEDFNKMQLAHQKEMQQMRAAMQEERAHLNTLRLADKPDQNEINKTIDEIAASQAKMMKAREAHRLEMRSKMTDEQKAWFDSFPHKGAFGKGKMNGMAGKCQCPMQGRGPCWNNDNDDNNQSTDFPRRHYMRQGRFNK